MKQTLKILTLSVLACAVAFNANAADKKKKKPTKAPVIVQVPKGIELSAEQTEAVADLNKKYAEQFAAARAKLNVVTPEQKKARAAAQKEAKAAGKKGKELSEAVNAAVSLTDAQKAQMKEGQKAVREVMAAARKEFAALLTDEQKAKLKGPKKKKDK
ncbi:MAG: hypothetical protein H8E27_07630 [Verrucomicrobia subdivision 3 bacterium]|nr:hypothetical protein [Limisphaerales bacterium]